MAFRAGLPSLHQESSSTLKDALRLRFKLANVPRECVFKQFLVLEQSCMDALRLDNCDAKLVEFRTGGCHCQAALAGASTDASTVSPKRMSSVGQDGNRCSIVPQPLLTSDTTRELTLRTLDVSRGRILSGAKSLGKICSLAPQSKGGNP